MFTFVGTGILVGGAVILGRKLYVSIQSLLHLSDDLDPLRQLMASDFNTPGRTRSELGSDTAPCVKSMIRLSDAVSRSREASYSDSEPSSVQPEVPVA